MKLIGAALLLCISTMTLAGEKTAVCHIPPGNMAKFKTIMVSDKAVAAHLKHGDKEGACGLLAEYLCNDNDPCTVDAFAVGTESCEFNVPGGDVPDGNDCTIDQCTAAVGYEYLPAPGGNVCNIAEGVTGTCGFAPDAGVCVPDVVDVECSHWTSEQLNAVPWELSNFYHDKGPIVPGNGSQVYANSYIWDAVEVWATVSQDPWKVHTNILYWEPFTQGVVEVSEAEGIACAKTITDLLTGLGY